MEVKRSQWLKAFISLNHELGGERVEKDAVKENQEVMIGKKIETDIIALEIERMKIKMTNPSYKIFQIQNESQVLGYRHGSRGKQKRRDGKNNPSKENRIWSMEIKEGKVEKA